eukprot:scaffold3731_cov156-Amphora_coffeaeformis.AAC.3
MKDYRLVSILLLALVAPQAVGFSSNARARQLPSHQSGIERISLPRQQQQQQSIITNFAQTAVAVSRYCDRSNGRCSLALTATTNEGDYDEPDSLLVPRKKARRSWRRRIRTWALSFALGTSMFRSIPANAKFSYELRETPTSSLRPGVSREQADLIEQGELDGRSVEAKTALAPEPEKPVTPKKAAAPKKQSSYYDDDDEDDNFLEEEAIGRAASQADQKTAKRLQSRSNFAAYHQGKSNSLTVKVAVAFFVPTYGAMIIREYVRRRKEEVYVQKGLEILEAQKAEYFNVTGTAADSDVQDALKKLKKNETKTDDDDDDDDDDGEDDDDDDDDDDEDDKPRGRKGGPKRPTGGGDDGGSSGSGDGSGRPSDEDLSRLNQMFNRS